MQRRGETMIKAVLWDFGGVLTTSPFEAFRRFEIENGLPENFIRTINATNPNDNAWAKLERSEIDVATFDTLFEEEARAAGHPVPGTHVLELLSGDLRPEMVEALRLCKPRFRTGCLTNNILLSELSEVRGTDKRTLAFQEVMALFDIILESSKVGVRKPDPKFYSMACDIMGIAPAEAVYLDDLGINLKPARTLGMRTIKVLDPGDAIAELESVLNIPLS
jgi:putative hydrolase of the HAD superfamily